MLLSRRFLLENTYHYIPPTEYQMAADSPEPLAVDSDIVVILAALLCALICVIGLALVARCAWLRRSSSSSSGSDAPPAPVPPPCNKGVKKKVIRSLPRISFRKGSGDASKLTDCAICLAEFVEGDEIRILPQCGHGFHIGCVDTWLGSHSSCPSCRRVLVVSPAGAAPALAPAPVLAPASSSLARCQRCGASSAAETAAEEEGGAKAREDGDANRFLP